MMPLVPFQFSLHRRKQQFVSSSVGAYSHTHCLEGRSYSLNWLGLGFELKGSSCACIKYKSKTNELGLIFFSRSPPRMVHYTWNGLGAWA